MTPPVLTKRTDDGNAYYTVRWSPLEKVDKYTIIKRVPAMAGIYELYFEDNYRKLIRFYVSKVWLGGLRSELRKVTDTELIEDERWKDLLENRTCYYRYVLSESFTDLSDVLFYFSEKYFPGQHRAEDSGRYDQIFVDEIEPNKIVTI
jgi:hypothetical protein